MQPSSRPRRVLVPILGGDITEAALALARAALDHPGARLALVHVMRPRQLAHHACDEHEVSQGGDVARWHRLAAGVPPDRVFVDAAIGDPAEVILSHARRFGSDLIVLGRSGPTTARAASSDRLIADLLRAAPGRVLVADAQNTGDGWAHPAERAPKRLRAIPRSRDRRPRAGTRSTRGRSSVRGSPTRAGRAAD